MTNDHQSADGGYQKERHDYIAVDVIENPNFLADDGDELEHAPFATKQSHSPCLENHQETRGRWYASEVKRNATLTWPLRNQYHSL